MEEGEYRSAYHSINRQRCLFEKSVLSRRAACCHAHRFCLADREGIACQNQEAMALCKWVLDRLRHKAVFALQMTRIDEPLPHAKEVKVQLGGLAGLNLLIAEEPQNNQLVEDIYSLIQKAINLFGDLELLPYDEITRSISQFRDKKRGRLSRD